MQCRYGWSRIHGTRIGRSRRNPPAAFFPHTGNTQASTYWCLEWIVTGRGNGWRGTGTRYMCLWDSSSSVSSSSRRTFVLFIIFSLLLSYTLRYSYRSASPTFHHRFVFVFASSFCHFLVTSFSDESNGYRIIHPYFTAASHPFPPFSHLHLHFPSLSSSVFLFPTTSVGITYHWGACFESS